MFVINTDMASVYNGFLASLYGDLKAANMIQIFDPCCARQKPNDIMFVKEIVQFEFLDIDEKASPDIYPDFAMTKEDAKLILEFIKKTDAQNRSLIVHCFAGVSRSGAVAKFASEKFNFIRRNAHCNLFNEHVYQLLNEVYDEA